MFESARFSLDLRDDFPLDNFGDCLRHCPCCCSRPSVAEESQALGANPSTSTVQSLALPVCTL